MTDLPSPMREGDEGEGSFRSVLQEHYRRTRPDALAHLRLVYDFALWFDAYAESEHGRANTGIGEVVDAMQEAGEIGWTYATVRRYRVLAGFEWKDLAKCGSLKKALKWCADEKRTPAERAQREQEGQT